MDPYRSIEPVAFVRYFACTDNSKMGLLTLALCKAMQKLRPVRTVSMTGAFVDQWMTQIHTTMTPLAGTFVNVVACDPARWTWTQTVQMPDEDPFVSAQMGGAPATPATPGKVETVTERMSLYTYGAHNVLYAVTPPRAIVELACAKHFEVVLVPDERHLAWWNEHGAGVKAQIVPQTEEDLRPLILGVGPDV